MFDVINLSFSIRCRWPSVIETVTMSHEEFQQNAAWSWQQ